MTPPLYNKVLPNLKHHIFPRLAKRRLECALIFLCLFNVYPTSFLEDKKYSPFVPKDEDKHSTIW